LTKRKKKFYLFVREAGGFSTVGGGLQMTGTQSFVRIAVVLIPRCSIKKRA
jgi:hypothetical protein